MRLPADTAEVAMLRLDNPTHGTRLRFLLADDPGAGKTIMAGLLLKEPRVRGDLERCLIVAPGALTAQWQDELREKHYSQTYYI